MCFGPAPVGNLILLIIPARPLPTTMRPRHGRSYWPICRQSLHVAFFARLLAMWSGVKPLWSQLKYLRSAQQRLYPLKTPPLQPR